MKTQATIVLLFLSALAGSSTARAVDFSEMGACFITTEQDTTCSLQTLGSCMSNNNREYGVTADWRTGPCPGEDSVSTQKAD